MTNQNIDIVLGNALCCSAKKAIELSDMLSRGFKCSNKYLRELVLLNNSIETLICREDIQDSEFNYTLSCIDYSTLLNTIPPLDIFKYYIEVTIDGSIKTYETTSNNVDNIWFLYLSLLNNITEIKEYTTIGCDDGSLNKNINIKSTCNVSRIYFYALEQLKQTVSLQQEYTNIIKGNCFTCLTEVQKDNLINNIMTTCEICDCQLKQ